MLLGVKVQHELGKRSVKSGNLAAQDHEAGARQHRAVVETHGRTTQFDVIAGIEIELRPIAPAPDFEIGVFIGAIGDRLMRNVGKAQEKPFELGLRFVEFGLRLSGLPVWLGVFDDHFLKSADAVLPDR